MPTPSLAHGAPAEGARALAERKRLQEPLASCRRMRCTRPPNPDTARAPRGAQVVRADAPPSALAQLCRRVCIPRLLLRAAELRAALVALGAEPGVGAQVCGKAARCCLRLWLCAPPALRARAQEEGWDVSVLKSP